MKTFLPLFKTFLLGYIFTFILLLIFVVSFDMEGGIVDGGIEMMYFIVAIGAMINTVSLLLFFLLFKSVKIFIADWKGVLVEVGTWVCLGEFLYKLIGERLGFYSYIIVVILLTGIIIFFYSKMQRKLVAYCLSLLLLAITVWVELGSG